MIEVFPHLLVAHLGGDEAVSMLCDHHIEGMTYNDLEQKYDFPRACIHSRIVKARMKLRGLGLMPEGWDGPALCVHSGAGAGQRGAS